MAKVCIIQRRLTHYRVSFFTALREVLAVRGIQLELMVGHGTSVEEKKHDAGVLPWAKSIPTYYLASGRLCWQSVQRYLSGSDLVVVPQENKLIQNLLLLLMPRRFKLAFWGHGANLQSNSPDGLNERFKRWTTNRVDWWFAYTQMSAGLVNAAGFPFNRISVLNNAVDTSEMQRQRLSITLEETVALRESLGFGKGPVGVFVGSLYADKRLDFLFSAAEAIHHEVSDFHLLVVGDGQEHHKVEAWCATHPWARWAGARFGREKIAYVSMAQLMLNPGALGLGVMDAFVGQVPMVTTNCGNHGPEIAYLENGVNGVMTSNDLSAYVETTVCLLRNPQALETLRAGCAASAQEYTVENMARRFADGIELCLSTPRYDRHGH